jgi:hypothetical protein
VGFLAATGDIDVPLLQQSFDLAPYDAFLPADTYTALEEAARDAANAAAAARAAASAETGPEEEGADSEGLQANSTRAQALPSEAEVARELSGLVMERLVAQPEGHTLAVVTMLCMLPEWEEAAVEFVAPLFEALPDKVRGAAARRYIQQQDATATKMLHTHPVPKVVAAASRHMIHSKAMLQCYHHLGAMLTWLLTVTLCLLLAPPLPLQLYMCVGVYVLTRQLTPARMPAAAPLPCLCPCSCTWACPCPAPPPSRPCAAS